MKPYKGIKYAFQFRGKTKRVVGYLQPLPDYKVSDEINRLCRELGYKSAKGVVFARMGEGSKL